MSGSACGPWCGWCGGCTSAWEGSDHVTVTCTQCGREYQEDTDERPPYRCEACCRNNAEEEARRRATR